jgi:hypothetical protein
MVINHGAGKTLLHSYENERKPVAKSVIDSSGELVRSTKYSETGSHAQDYVKIVQKRAGNITGMGIRYGVDGLPGSRLFDFEVIHNEAKTRLYSLLDYTQFTLIIFGDGEVNLSLPNFVKVIQIRAENGENDYYKNVAIIVRPDSYIESVMPLENSDSYLNLANFYKTSMGHYELQ